MEVGITVVNLGRVGVGTYRHSAVRIRGEFETVDEVLLSAREYWPTSWTDSDGDWPLGIVWHGHVYDAGQLDKIGVWHGDVVEVIPI